MRSPPTRLFCLFAAALSAVRSDPNVDFANSLEQCIRHAAKEAADAFPDWGNACLPPTQKIDKQAAILTRTLGPIRGQYGYTAALWCGFYSVRMTGAEYNPNAPQPNNPNYPDWYVSLLCPWDVDVCGNEPLGKHGKEWEGISVRGAPHQNAQYLTDPPDIYVAGEPNRRTMTCGMCGHLKRKLGKPPFFAPTPKIEIDADLYTANWDFHPFGAWLANEAAHHGHSISDIVNNIHVWKASNGEEMHGYLWQSLRLLAYDTGTLEGNRKAWVDDRTGQLHAMKVCKPAWWLSPQTRDDCSHAAGHGFFYYYLDIGRAVSACWTDLIVDFTPGDWADSDMDTRLSGLNAQDLLKWRWLCATGVYHAAGNTLSVEILQKLNDVGSGAEEYLCKRSNLWGDDAYYFDRCAAGRGMKEREERRRVGKEGKCKPVPGREPAPWELQQLRQFGHTMQLSCNPAKYFVQANDQCPLAYRAHFPCNPDRKDYKFCIKVRRRHSSLAPVAE